MAVRIVEGHWGVDQSNKMKADFIISQQGDFISGSASLSGGDSGTGQGSVSSDEFKFTVNWRNGSISEYVGRFDFGGLLRGTMSHRKIHPPHEATFVSNRTFIGFM
jgi:hypothetical protein